MSNSRVALRVQMALSAVAYSCGSADQPPTEATRKPIPVPSFAVNAPYFSASPEVAQRIRKAEERYAWISRLHSEAIREAHAERMQWPKKDRKNVARICSQARRLGLKYLAKANLADGKAAGSDEDNLSIVLKGMSMAPKCRDQVTAAPSMSLFLRPTYAGVINPFASTIQPSELEERLSELGAAFQNSGLTGYQMIAAMDTVVVAGAESLSQSELEILVAEGQLALSSLVEWQTIWESGNWGGGGGGGGGGDPMSIFKPSTQWWYQWDVFWFYYFNPAAKGISLADLTCGLLAWEAGPFSILGAAVICSISAYGLI